MNSNTLVKQVSRLLIAFTLLFSHLAIAALHIRDLDGNWSNGHEGVYDDVLDITWLADANLAGLVTWEDANTSIANLNSATYLGFDSWRLPSALDWSTPGCVLSYSGGDCGWNVYTYEESSGTVFSELAYMYFENFSAVSKYSTGSSPNAAGTYGITNAADPSSHIDFFNGTVENWMYWTSLEEPSSTSNAWHFRMNSGLQTVWWKSDGGYVWAVHDGDIGTAVVPLPATVWPFLSGLFVIMGLKHRVQRRKPH